MKVVFVAGPYRSSTEYGVMQNIRAAEDLALRVWKTGVACICPHKNTAFYGGEADDALWLDGALEMVRRSDAIVCTPDWQDSEGARGEVALARELAIPVFETFEEYEKWLVSQDQKAN